MTKLTKDMVRKAMKDCSGVYAVIAKRCHVSRSAMSQFFQKKENKDLLIDLDDERQVNLDIGERKLMVAVNKGEGWAIKYLLSTQGKSRGYVERQEIEAKIDGQLNNPAMNHELMSELIEKGVNAKPRARAKRK